MRQLLVVSQIAQNQTYQENFLLVFVPLAFFWQVWYVPHTISTSNIYFGDRLLIPVILSYIAAEYDHFQPFYRILKNGHFWLKNPWFFRKNRNFLLLDWRIKVIDETKNINMLGNKFNLSFLMFLKVFSMFW